MSELDAIIEIKYIKHPKCKGTYDAWSDESDCEYNTSLACDECKYGNLGGRKDPAAKCNGG